MVALTEKYAYQIHEHSLATTWSPTSERVAYSIENELYIHNVLSDTVPQNLGQWGQHILGVSWSPVEDVLALVVRPNETAASAHRELSVIIVEVATGQHNVLGAFAARETEATALDLVWASEGQEVYWFGPVKAAGIAGLAFSLAGKAARPLELPELASELALSWRGYVLSPGVPGPLPIFSLNGEQLVWGTLRGNQVGLWRQPLDAATPAAAVANLPAPVWHIMWAADDRYLIAAGNWETLGAIWLVDMANGEQYRLAEAALLLNLPPATIRLLPLFAER